jgi:hypothetical protein
MGVGRDKPPQGGFIKMIPGIVEEKNENIPRLKWRIRINIHLAQPISGDCVINCDTRPIRRRAGVAGLSLSKLTHFSEGCIEELDAERVYLLCT